MKFIYISALTILLGIAVGAPIPGRKDGKKRKVPPGQPPSNPSGDSPGASESQGANPPHGQLTQPHLQSVQPSDFPSLPGHAAPLTAGTFDFSSLDSQAYYQPHTQSLQPLSTQYPDDPFAQNPPTPGGMFRASESGSRRRRPKGSARNVELPPHQSGMANYQDPTTRREPPGPSPSFQLGPSTHNPQFVRYPQSPLPGPGAQSSEPGPWTTTPMY